MAQLTPENGPVDTGNGGSVESGIIINQRTEGLLESYLSIIANKDTITIREAGIQIGTEWATDLVFVFNPVLKNLSLKKAISYQAKITSKGINIISPVKEILVPNKILIDSVNYYNYFPFGFTDDIPEN